MVKVGERSSHQGGGKGVGLEHGEASFLPSEANPEARGETSLLVLDQLPGWMVWV